MDFENSKLNEVKRGRIYALFSAILSSTPLWKKTALEMFVPRRSDLEIAVGRSYTRSTSQLSCRTYIAKTNEDSRFVFKDWRPLNS